MTLPRPPVALLASELGGGRGHVATLARVARALGPDVTKLAAIGVLRHAGELTAQGVRVLRCPKLGATAEAKADPASRGNATWSCYLADSGFMRPEVLRASLTFWRQLIVAENVSLLVADYAPLALRAAHALREEGWEIRIITVGTGYGIPPGDLVPLPPTTRGFDRVVHPEPKVLAALNAVGAELGMSALPHLSALYQVDLSLVGTFDFLDPYAGWRTGRLVPPLVERSAGLARGDEVFVYFSREEAELPALAEALCHLPLPRRGFLPGASDAVKSRLAASGMIVEPGPVPVDLIAKRSRLMIHPSPHGSLCMAALAGLPQIGLPGHKEQITHARRAEAAGVLRVLAQRQSTADQIIAAVTDLYHDSAARMRAQALALELRADFPADPMADLAARLAPEVAAARAFVSS
jgi:hypothetical protein